MGGLGLLRPTVKPAEVRIKELADNGALMKQFHNAHAPKKFDVESRAVALLLLTSQSFATPGDQSWQSLLDDRAELVGMIDTALLEFDSSDNIATLVMHAVSNPNALGLVSAIVSVRVREGRIGSLYIDRVIAELPQYLNCIEEELRDQFIRKIPGYASFWGKIDAAALDANVIRILGELIKSGSGNEDKAREVLEKKLKAVTAEGWAAALGSGNEPLPIARSLSTATGKAFHLTTILYGALEAAIAALLANDDNPFRQRWFNALDLVSPSSRVTLLKTVRDQIARGTTVAGLAAFLLEGGDGLLADGAFIEEADGAVRYVVLRLLENPDGINWLAASAAKLQPWIARSDEATRNVTVERLSELWRTADDGGKEQLTKLADAWNLPKLPVEDSHDKDDGTENTGR